MAQQMQLGQQQAADVYQLAAVHQLGTVVREYKDRSTSKTILGLVVGVLGAICILISILLFLHSGIVRGEIYILFLGIALVGLGASWARIASRNRGARAYLCTDGVMRVQSGRAEAVRWNQITAVQKTFHFSESWKTYTLRQYILYRTDGIALTLDNVFNNFKELGAAIEREVTSSLLPLAVATYDAGRPIDFGPISLSFQGISVQKEQKSLPWHELKAVDVRDEQITIKKNGSLLDWATIRTSEVVNFCVLVALISHIREGKRETGAGSYQPQPATNYNPQPPQWQGSYVQTGYAQPYEGNYPQPFQSSYVPLPPQSQAGSGYAPPSTYPAYNATVSMPEPARHRGLALAGFILGIVCAFACAGLFSGISALVLISWLCGLPISIIGVILSALGCRSVSRRGIAIVGLILSIIALVLTLFFTVMFIVYLVSPSS